jgi:tetratricopeptide (TPR) repeat protein
VVEYIAAFMESNEVAPLDAFVFDISQRNSQGNVLMMPAGRKDENYQTCLSRLDWKFLYKQKSGYFFVENLKAAIREQYAPDYILIDSRTGLTDISGICTLQLPDLVVMLFSLNNQNVRGTSQIYKSIKFNKLNRPIKTLLVASPIPDVPESVEIRRERFENARKCIGGAPDLILPFDPFMAFQETIASGSQSQALMQGYNELTDMIIGSNPSDTRTLLREAKRLTEIGNAELAELKYREVLETHPDSWEALLNFGIFQRTRGRTEEAAQCFKKALELAPNNGRAISQMSATALELGRIEEAREYADRLIRSERDADELVQLGKLFQRRGVPDTAFTVFKRAASISPDQNTLFYLGEGAMALKLYDEAFNAYRRSMDEQPSYLAAVYNTAYAAQQLGRSDAAELFQRSVELFEHQQTSKGMSEYDANALFAMALAYLALHRPDKALRLLQNARRLAVGSDAARFFSPSEYTYIPKDQFVSEIDLQVKQIDEFHHDIAAPTVPTTITLMKSHGGFILSLKRGERTRRIAARSFGGLTDLLTSIGIDAGSAARYVERVRQGHAVQVNADLDPDVAFRTAE